MESILTSIKKLLGIVEEYEQFDADIIMHINSVLMVLTQLGIGPKEGFIIEDETAIWDDFLDDPTQLQAVKSYVYMRVRLLFDPPDRSAVMEAFKSQIAEFEWRLNVAAESNQSD